ncbi:MULTISPECIES: hypothetical protein [Arthrobacter]|uniref:Uncharacterized protein n=1 Tax=Arthrobacter terricola TaxID=2547396 RepID=A0A4R5KAY5_9MICC|nr:MULTISPECIES: hypothetical protein [Arthrobacter]MBT8162788.1 hypothetical protein [Arthrobacter sp. GN70]TDF92052.1 hypothetical protein E1809_18910 [Arthrobacter terricola]
MALTSVYYDGPVTETDRAANRGSDPDYLVYGVDDFKVTAHPSIPYAVLVKAGRAEGFGVTDTAAIDQVVNCDALPSGTRWDLIVVRRNWQPLGGGPSTLAAISVGADPTIPGAPTRKVGPGVEDDQPIALVKWQGGTSAPVQFIDLRMWAGNGGLFAKDNLVRTFMNKIGTVINIAGAIWSYQLGANDVPGWVKLGEIGKVELFGVGTAVFGTPPPGTSFLEQEGTIVQKTNDVGAQRLVWPVPFPNGLQSLRLDSGDSFGNGRGVVIAPAGGSGDYGTAGWGDKQSVVYEVVDAAGNLLKNKTVRISWSAKGW